MTTSEHDDRSVNLEAEMIVLYSMVLENSHVDLVCNFLEVADFFSVQHQIIYKRILALRSESGWFSAAELGHALKFDGMYDRAGGTEKLHDLSESVSTDQAIEYYMKIVKECSQRRAVIETAQGIAIDGGGQTDTPKYLEDARDRMIEATKNAKHDDGVRPIGDGLTTMRDELFTDTEPKGLVRTCINKIDTACGGLWPGLMTVVACRPSVGKSMFALNVALNAAFSGKRILFISLEDTKRFIQYRIFARLCGINTKAITQKKMTAEEKDQFNKKIPVVDRLPLDILDRGVMGSQSIGSAVTRYSDKNHVDLIILDHLGHIREKGLGLYEATTQGAQTMAQLAKDLDVPVMVLHQLNRESEKRDDKIPRMSDLRQSGEVEQLARQIWLLHRPAQYDETADPREMCLDMVKNSHGEKCTIKLYCRPEHMLISGENPNYGERYGY